MAQVVPLFFVEEKHAIVCQTDFAGFAHRSAADKCHVADGVVRRSEGTLGYERSLRFQLAGDGMYLGCFETFGQCELGKDGWEPLGHHAFAASGRADEHDVVSAGRCHLKGALHCFLSFHVQEIVGEMRLCGIKFLAGVDDGGL